MQEKQIYKKAIEQWGIPAQITMAVEECAELIVKLVKSNRQHNGTTKYEIIDEIVDVTIMMEQMKMIFDTTTGDGKYQVFEYYKKKKLERLERRLDEE